jgi:hypothetical protein
VEKERRNPRRQGKMEIYRGGRKTMNQTNLEELSGIGNVMKNAGFCNWRIILHAIDEIRELREKVKKSDEGFSQELNRQMLINDEREAYLKSVMKERDGLREQVRKFEEPRIHVNYSMEYCNEQTRKIHELESELAAERRVCIQQENEITEMTKRLEEAKGIIELSYLPSIDDKNLEFINRRNAFLATFEKKENEEKVWCEHCRWICDRWDYYPPNKLGSLDASCFSLCPTCGWPKPTNEVDKNTSTCEQVKKESEEEKALEEIQEDLRNWESGCDDDFETFLVKQGWRKGEKK